MEILSQYLVNCVILVSVQTACFYGKIERKNDRKNGQDMVRGICSGERECTS